MIRASNLIKFLYVFLIQEFIPGPGFAGQPYDFIVAWDGSGDYLTVQEAFNAVPHLRKNRTTIFIKQGTYKEKLILSSTKINVTLIGENVEGTILTFDDYSTRKNSFGEEMGTSGSSGFYIFGEGFVARNITFSNTAGMVGQAVAVRIDGDMVVFENCRFLGFQDTLYPHGERSRQYYRNCYIEGTVDFIFGWSTALFENCTIHCKSKGYITAASTPEFSEYGFVFLHCKITGDAPEGSVYLGRPWRPFAKVAFIRCDLGRHIHPHGWHNWNKPEAEHTAYYAEFRNQGEGASTTERVPWSHQLNSGESNTYTPVNILGEWVLEYTDQLP